MSGAEYGYECTFGCDSFTVSYPSLTAEVWGCWALWQLSRSWLHSSHLTSLRHSNVKKQSSVRSPWCQLENNSLIHGSLFEVSLKLPFRGSSLVSVWMNKLDRCNLVTLISLWRSGGVMHTSCGQGRKDPHNKVHRRCTQRKTTVLTVTYEQSHIFICVRRHIYSLCLPF